MAVIEQVEHQVLVERQVFVRRWGGIGAIGKSLPQRRRELFGTALEGDEVGAAVGRVAADVPGRVYGDVVVAEGLLFAVKALRKERVAVDQPGNRRRAAPIVGGLKKHGRDLPR